MPPYPPPYPPSYPSPYPSSHQSSHQSSSLHTEFSSRSTPLFNTSYNDNIITEPSIRDFLKELGEKFGKTKYTIYLQQFEKEEITVSQFAEMNPETLLNEFGIEVIGRKLNLIKEAKKYL